MAGAGAARPPASPGGRYQILGHLAQGGMGEILLARRLGPAGFQKLVVLKRPLAMPVGSGSRALEAALIEEARLLARINHPNVCQVHDLEEADGQFYLSLEFLEGLTLWTILARLEAQGGALAAEPGVLCGLFEQVCDGLDAIHGMRGRAGAPVGVVHRDISPGNLFVTESGTVKILDLGIAKIARSSESEDRTPFGRVKGKLPYVSPEQAAGRPIDGRSDLFSLGLVIYDLARGRRPPPDRIGALAHDALELGGLPEELAAIIARATAADPARWFASARELGGALRAAAARLGGSSGRAELAEWLARRFGPELARRRARTEEAIAGGAEPATATRQLSLRSVISLDEADAIGSGMAEAREATAGMGTAMAMAMPPGLRSRETERLMLPEDERLPRREPAGERAVAAPSRRSVSWTRRIALVGLVAVALAGLAAVLLGRNAPTTEPREATVEQTAVPVPAATLAPEPAQPASAGTTEPAPAPSTPPPRRSGSAPARPKPASRTASAATGTVTIDSDPYAVVRDGSVSLGTTPIYRRPMKPGRHRLRATAADGREQVFAIDVEAGRETLRKLDWSRR